MKHIVRWTTLFGLAALALVCAGPAGAQSTYPPGGPATCTNTGDVNLGVMNVGDTRGASVCGPYTGFVTFTKEGQPAGGKNANADGSVPVAVSILSPTQANVDDIVTIHCGTNVLTLTGAAAQGGAAITRNVTFTLNCVNNIAVVSPTPFFPVSAFPFTSAFPASQQQQQQQQQQIIGGSAPAGGGAAAPAAAPAASTGGRVRFTGANVLRWTIVSLALVGVGSLLVLSGRRKAQPGFGT